MKNKGKTILVLLVSLAMLGLAVTASAQSDKAGCLDRKGMRSSSSTKAMIDRGTLKQGSVGQWLLDDVPLVFTEDSRVSRVGSGTGYVALDEGSQALVLGSRRNGQLVVTRVLMLAENDQTSRAAGNGANEGDAIQMAPADAPR